MKRRYVKAIWRLKAKTKSTPRNWRRDFLHGGKTLITGLFLPIEFKLDKLTFHPNSTKLAVLPSPLAVAPKGKRKLLVSG
jgi:hypothetical protein